MPIVVAVHAIVWSEAACTAACDASQHVLPAMWPPLIDSQLLVPAGYKAGKAWCLGMVPLIHQACMALLSLRAA